MAFKSISMAKFRTSARTVDMLGRQQIAGIPTAISELFKNAHDAYATRVEVDFYRPEQILVLRDNGLGMTMKDVIDRWLVLGTDSKFGGGKELTDVAVPLGMPARTPTGEKGIGRLAIAAIGPQVLLVTRAQRSDGIHPTVVSFVNWSLFALPGIALDEIEVPIREFHNGALPTAEDLTEMVETVRANLERLRPECRNEDIVEIEKDLDQASFDVTALQRRFETATLHGAATGTQFYIQPTDPMLETLLDAPIGKQRIGDLQKTLAGFTNTMMPDRPEPVIATAFRDHKSPDFFDSVIGPEAFFTQNEFTDADHHIQGEFDEYGQFEGEVAIYGRQPEAHRVVWPGAQGQQTLCGRFSINFAYVQGRARESRMPREQWGKINEKLIRMGGLYIYRNGIRILPYGSTDNDFLDIEERRSFGASYYFFSARRMFGAIELPLESSIRLSEKAGREGFRDNRAYRQFRDILINFLVQLAADFFRDDSPHGDFNRRKLNLDIQAKALEQHTNLSRVRHRQWLKVFEDRATRLSSDEPGKVVADTIAQLTRAVDAAKIQHHPDAKLRLILDAERTAQTALAALGSELHLRQPRGFALSQNLRRNLTAYNTEYSNFYREVLLPSYTTIEHIVSEATRNLKASRRRRFDAATADALQSAKKIVTARRNASNEQLVETSEKVANAVQHTISKLDKELKAISQRVQRTDLSNLADEEIVQLRLDFEAEFETVTSTKVSQLEAIAEQLRSIVVDPNDFGQIITQVDIAGAVEVELLALQERADADLELTQLGMAIEIIDHEFQAIIRSLRNNLRRFKAWADINEQLAEVYHGVSVNFEHLDSYLTLFTPLHRRLYRSEVEIRGRDINKFLLALFKDRLSRHDVKIVTTKAFLRFKFFGYPSTFYPVFVNLIDNAIFWLRDQEPPRIVYLDVEDNTMIVGDNGPGVSSEELEVIFELGFTRKPGGRGLGLYISRDVLRRAGYALTVGESRDGKGTEFRIQPRE